MLCVVSAAEVLLCSGEDLNLTCFAAPGEMLLKWCLMIPGHSQPDIRFISSAGPSENNVSAFAIGQTTFRFLRTSTSPLTSLMIINNVAAELNGTQVDCSYDNVMVSTTVINVFGNGNFYACSIHEV